jgi:HlyD family secretion protein
MTRRSRRIGWCLGGVLGLVCLAALLGARAHWGRPRRAPVATVAVARIDLERVRIVNGDVAGRKETLIECELEDLPDPDGRIREPGLLILDLIDEGTRVRKGDVLCRFDSSRYVELVRRAQLELERARAEEGQAKAEMEMTASALRAYRDGEATQIAHELESKIALARADAQQASERVGWATHMRSLGYLSSNDLAASRSALWKQQNDLGLRQTQLRTHRLYTVPKHVRELEVAVENTRRRLEFCTDQRESYESRLRKRRRLVEACTVRAPHDGLVVYADTPWHDPNDDRLLRPGKRIFEGWPMFILPDLAHPVVEIELHEADLGRVRAGQVARVTIPALGLVELPGRIDHVDPLPKPHWRAWTLFQGVQVRVTLDTVPDRLRPGLSARVAIVTDTLPDTLVVPTACVAIENGRPFCALADPDGSIRRRPVRIAPADRDRVAILAGLDEGDRIAVDPSPLRTLPASCLSVFPDAGPADSQAPRMSHIARLDAHPQDGRGM